MDNIEIFKINNEDVVECTGIINYEGSRRTIDLFKVDLPYPPVEGIVPNKMNCAIIKSLYTGQYSELTSVLQYFYGACRLKEQNEDIYKALKYISVVEMEHMDILGEVIVALGGDPKYTYNTGTGETFWTGRNVKYSKSPRQILLESILLEENAIESYNEACTLIKDEAVTCILKRIVMDECKHLEVFKELYKRMM